MTDLGATFFTPFPKGQRGRFSDRVEHFSAFDKYTDLSVLIETIDRPSRMVAAAEAFSGSLYVDLGPVVGRKKTSARILEHVKNGSKRP